MIKKNSDKKAVKYLVLAGILLVVGFFLPFLGEFVRVRTIGEEHQCCMMYNTEAEQISLRRRLEQAKEKRGLANLYMIGGMSMGLATSVAAGVVFYYNLKKAELKRWVKVVLGIVFGLLLVFVLFYAGIGLIKFLSDIDEYYSLGGWGHIYYFNR